MEFKSSEIIKRYDKPIITYSDVPYFSNSTLDFMFALRQIPSTIGASDARVFQPGQEQACARG
jgi:hypothetical protein